MTDFITFRNAPIHYRKTGKGPWVVLLHGFLESLEIWNDFALQLENEFSLLMIDLPGHGRSGLMGEVNTMADMADVVLAVADSEQINKFVVCGHSMGGYVAVELAKHAPERIKGAVFLHSHIAPDDEQAKENRRRTVNIVKLNHTGFIRQFIPDLFSEINRERLASEIEKLSNRAASTSAKSIIASLEGMKERSGGLDLLLETEIPLFFVIGKNDSRMPYNKVMAQAMMGRNIQVQLLDNVGHMSFLEAPEKVFPVLRDFFRRSHS
ncbi:MAG: alpha/beta hydrolase [Lentimicrobium sp.]|jgi:pimeloyl-ACP methyl ester carboxylesterase|nr:alpha/beta hydrolase [Lentimicrobium sp.]